MACFNNQSLKSARSSESLSSLGICEFLSDMVELLASSHYGRQCGCGLAVNHVILKALFSSSPTPSASQSL